MSNILKLIISLIIPQVAGGIGSFFTMSKVPSWYAGLVRPSFNPPSWVFGPVWTALFLLMGYALYMVWRGPKTQGQNIALIVFGVQMVLNTLWSILFFGLQSPGWALVEIVFLWLAILFTIILFWRLNRTAGILLLPYILWVSFAAFLNYSIWRLN